MNYENVKLRKRKVTIKYEDRSFMNVNEKVLRLPENIFNGALVRVKSIKSEKMLLPSTVTSSEAPVMKKEKRRRRKMKKNKAPLSSARKVKRETPKSTTNATSNDGRPTVEECVYVTEALASLHPEVVDRNDALRRKTMLESCGMRTSVTEAIVSTMLSQNTTDANSKSAFANLKRIFGRREDKNSINWDDVANPDNLIKLENAIRVAGLAKTRSQRIQTMLNMVQAEHNGSTSMEYLREWTDDECIKKELSRFPGLGPKTISCVLLFALNRPEFPVDTHVLRICQIMGWVSSSHNRVTAYEHLNSTVPNHLKMDLHCLLVAHGKHCHHCAANHRPQFPPSDGTKLPCPLRNVSKWKGIIPKATTAVIQLKPILSSTFAIIETNNFNHHCPTPERLKIKLEQITPDPVTSTHEQPFYNTLQVKKEE